jgi:hypothetical protein
MLYSTRISYFLPANVVELRCSTLKFVNANLYDGGADLYFLLPPLGADPVEGGVGPCGVVGP